MAMKESLAQSYNVSTTPPPTKKKKKSENNPLCETVSTSVNTKLHRLMHFMPAASLPEDLLEPVSVSALCGFTIASDHLLAHAPSPVALRSQ